MPFYVKIHGSNASMPAAYGDKGTRLIAGSLGGEVVERASERRAVFATRDAANDAGLACRWNGQRYTVHVCSVDSGLTIERQNWESCQSFR